MAKFEDIENGSQFEVREADRYVKYVKLNCGARKVMRLADDTYTYKPVNAVRIEDGSMWKFENNEKVRMPKEKEK